jgi:hypothetical protein
VICSTTTSLRGASCSRPCSWCVCTDHRTSSPSLPPKTKRPAQSGSISV